ncbi:Tyrosine kinase-like (TKL) protein, partial [Cardiosporidium cionae]
MHPSSVKECLCNNTFQKESIDTKRFPDEHAAIIESKAKQQCNVGSTHGRNGSTTSKFPYPYLNLKILQQRPLDVALLNTEKVSFDDLFKTSAHTLLRNDWRPNSLKFTKEASLAHIFPSKRSSGSLPSARLNQYPKIDIRGKVSIEEQSKTSELSKTVWIKNTTLFLRNGDIYSGEQYLSWKHGSGIYLWKDGRAYAGFWYKNKRHGWGVFLLENGSKYEGFWKRDKKHGYGCQSLPKGKRYIGQFKNDELHGRGILVYPNGMLYTGIWEKGYNKQLELLFVSLENHRFERKTTQVQSNSESQSMHLPLSSSPVEENLVKNLATFSLNATNVVSQNLNTLSLLAEISPLHSSLEMDEAKPPSSIPADLLPTPFTSSPDTSMEECKPSPLSPSIKGKPPTCRYPEWAPNTLHPSIEDLSSPTSSSPSTRHLPATSFLSYPSDDDLNDKPMSLFSTPSPSNLSSSASVSPMDKSKDSKTSLPETASSLQTRQFLPYKIWPQPYRREPSLPPQSVCKPQVLPMLPTRLSIRESHAEAGIEQSTPPLSWLVKPSSQPSVSVVPSYSSSFFLARQPSALLSLNPLLPSSLGNTLSALPYSSTYLSNPSLSFTSPTPLSSLSSVYPSKTSLPSSVLSPFLSSSAAASETSSSSSPSKTRKNSSVADCLGWNQEHVCYFLYCIGCHKFAALFRYHHVEGSILPWITEASLQDMAIPLWEERRYLLLAIDLLLKERNISVFRSSFSPIKFHADPNLGLFEIPAEDLILEESVGEGSYGTVYKASWKQKHLFAPSTPIKEKNSSQILHFSTSSLQEVGQKPSKKDGLSPSSLLHTKKSKKSSYLTKNPCASLSILQSQWPLSHHLTTFLATSSRALFTSPSPPPPPLLQSTPNAPSLSLSIKEFISSTPRQTPTAPPSLTTALLPASTSPLCPPTKYPSLKKNLDPSLSKPKSYPPLSRFFSIFKPPSTPKLPPHPPSTVGVAVKIFRQRDHRALQRNFYSEMRVLTRLRHPNITLFLGVTLSPHYCLVTEYIPNGSLFDLLHVDNFTLSLKQCFRTAIEICCGMVYLHHHGILHCDLKSSNILISEYGHVKICDFGLASLAEYPMEEDLPRHMGCVGSLHWMAPEVLRGEGMTKASDIYSFGVILWEMLTREIPRA